MKVYRLTKRKYANDLTGQGAKVVGGRWNSKGNSILYTASSVSLALLEVLVHLPVYSNLDFVIVEIEIPDDLIVSKLDSSILPTNLKFQINMLNG